MWYYKESYVGLVAIPVFSLLLGKSFVIFHHCGHNNFTPSNNLNYMIGSLLGILLLTPFSWNYDHGIHHKTSGKEDNTLYHKQNETIHHTFTQYNDMNIINKYITKLWRSPYIYFTVDSFIHFVIKCRFEIIYEKIIYKNYSPSTFSIIIDNIVSIICNIILLGYFYNNNILYSYISSIFLAYSILMSVFHNQHTFNPPYVSNAKEWTKQDSGIRGSSFLQLPKWLKFIFYGDEYHHVHHMLASIPPYHLRETHEYLEKTEPGFKNIVKLSMKDCYNNLWLTLYDEESDRYISFEEADNKIKNL